jgi:polyisoprenoid-binding protein YceI
MRLPILAGIAVAGVLASRSLTPPPATAHAAALPWAQAAVTWEVAGDGNVARYRVRERLLGRDRDNDAVGETPTLRGRIALDAAGRVVPAGSRFSADLSQLTSDESRRDNYVRRRLLVTDSFPEATLQVTAVRNLPTPLPTSGRVSFELVGDLTVKGVTRPTTWTVTATVDGDRLTGRAATRFTFADFQLTQPRVSIVLSVADTIGLEYDFTMRRVAR